MSVQPVFHLEVRPGEGGEDAARFATELADALANHARRRGLTVTAGKGRDRTIVLDVAGPDPRGTLDWLCGTHRVQRVPSNDRSGRRHTSTASVALVAGDADRSVSVRESDITMEVYRGSGPGGQHRNKTSTAVRLRHVPTGIVVSAERSRSQDANRAAARAELERQLTERSRARSSRRRDEDRRSQILQEGYAAAGERPAKSFTHDHFRGCVRDHTTGRRFSLRDFQRGRVSA